MNEQKYSILKRLIYLSIPTIEEVFNTSLKHGGAITLEDLLRATAKEEYSLSRELNVNESTANRLVKKLFPDKPKGMKICSYLLGLHGLKWCSGCKQVKDYKDFSSNISRVDRLASTCRDCANAGRNEYQREYQSRRRASKLQRTPKWANLDAIKEIYAKCPEGYHVDHILPLQGDLVSGLHVENNLQYLIASENTSKGNRYIPE